MNERVLINFNNIMIADYFNYLWWQVDLLFLEVKRSQSPTHVRLR